MGWTPAWQLVRSLWGERSAAASVPRSADGTAAPDAQPTVQTEVPNTMGGSGEPLSNGTGRESFTLFGVGTTRTIGGESASEAFYPDSRSAATLDDCRHRAETSANPTDEQRTAAVEPWLRYRHAPGTVAGVAPDS